MPQREGQFGGQCPERLGETPQQLGADRSLSDDRDRTLTSWRGAMGPIPGAREELDRLGRALRSQLTTMIDDLTPGSDLSLLFLDEPRIVDWHEPLRYQYAAESFTGRRPVHVGAADIASRAAAMLTASGWRQSTTNSREDPGRTPRIVVTGRHDNGCSIEIHVTAEDDHSVSPYTVWFSGRTPAMALREPEDFRWPEPIRTAETVTSGYVLCYECDGLGWCSHCGGRGWVPDEQRGRRKCPACHRRRVCLICCGAAELATSELSSYQRGYYPELEQ